MAATARGQRRAFLCPRGAGGRRRRLCRASDLELGLGAEEARELAGTHRVLELADGLGLDLADALAGDLEDPAYLLERVGVAVADAVAELDDLALAVRSASRGRRSMLVASMTRDALSTGIRRSSSMKSPK
jgi:hypothetical protein